MMPTEKAYPPASQYHLLKNPGASEPAAGEVEEVSANKGDAEIVDAKIGIHGRIIEGVG